MEAEAICGKHFTVEKPPEHPEELCLFCGKEQCMTYTLYNYAVTHYNHP